MWLESHESQNEDTPSALWRIAVPEGACVGVSSHLHLWSSATKKRLPGEVTSLDNRWAGVSREEVAAGGLEPPTKGL